MDKKFRLRRSLIRDEIAKRVKSADAGFYKKTSLFAVSDSPNGRSARHRRSILPVSGFRRRGGRFITGWIAVVFSLLITADRRRSPVF